MATPCFRTLIAICGVAAGLQAAAAVRWSTCLRQPAAWYGGDEARAIARMVLRYQSPEGGWPKNRDMTLPPETYRNSKEAREPTIDNDATTTQMEFLARVWSAGPPDGAFKSAFLRGFDYLLEAQYPNGGWPQFYPLRKGYYTHITYNDNAMVNVLNLLRDSAAGRRPYAFVDEARRVKAADAVKRGIACILRTQVKEDGKLTVWCAQHDETTFEPAWARNFEPPSLSGEESVGVVRFLMGIDHPGPDVIAAVEGAVSWFRQVEIHGLRVDNSPGSDGRRDRHTVADPGAPVAWARFYELGTNRPIYIGRDRIIRYDFNEIERERRTGYVYVGYWPARLLAKDYPAWLKRLGKEAK